MQTKIEMKFQYPDRRKLFTPENLKLSASLDMVSPCPKRRQNLYDKSYSLPYSFPPPLHCLYFSRKI